VAGVILNLAVWFELTVVFGRVAGVDLAGIRLFRPEWATIEWASLVLTIAALIVLSRFGTGMLPALAAAAGPGTLYQYVM